jgi:hypothetical protein
VVAGKRMRISIWISLIRMYESSGDGRDVGRNPLCDTERLL